MSFFFLVYSRVFSSTTVTPPKRVIQTLILSIFTPLPPEGKLTVNEPRCRYSWRTVGMCGYTGRSIQAPPTSPIVSHREIFPGREIGMRGTSAGPRSASRFVSFAPLQEFDSEPIRMLEVGGVWVIDRCWCVLKFCLKNHDSECLYIPD